MADHGRDDGLGRGSGRAGAPGKARVFVFGESVERILTGNRPGHRSARRLAARFPPRRCCLTATLRHWARAARRGREGGHARLHRAATFAVRSHAVDRGEPQGLSAAAPQRVLLRRLSERIRDDPERLGPAGGSDSLCLRTGSRRQGRSLKGGGERTALHDRQRARIGRHQPPHKAGDRGMYAPDQCGAWARLGSTWRSIPEP